MSGATAEATKTALCTVFGTHGVPEEWVTGNGAQFFAHEFKDFLRSNKIKHMLNAPYHPAFNSKAERAVKTFKRSMKTAKGDPGTQNEKILPFLLSCRTTPYSTTGCIPAELLINRRLHRRLDLLRPDLREKIAQPSCMQPRAPRKQLSIGDIVLT